MTDDTPAQRKAKESYLEYDWRNEDWQNYYNGIFPPPKTATILYKYKKKWFKKNVDDYLDLAWDPAPLPKIQKAPEGYEGFTRPKKGSGYDRGISISVTDGTFLFWGYVSLVISGPVIVVFFPSLISSYYIGQLALTCMDITSHFGFKFNRGWFATIFIDESGHLLNCLVAFYPLQIRMMYIILLFILGSSNLLAMGQLAKSYNLRLIPASLKKRVSVFAEPSLKFSLMQTRTHVELVVFVCVLFMGIKQVAWRSTIETGDITPVIVLIHGNLIWMRHQSDPFMQAGIRTVDSLMMKVFRGSLLEGAYKNAKNGLSWATGNNKALWY